MNKRISRVVAGCKSHGITQAKTLKESIDVTESSVVSRSPDIMGGTPVFLGTRVPVQTLIDQIEAGDTIDDFLQGFPSVSRAQVFAFLETARDLMIASAV